MEQGIKPVSLQHPGLQKSAFPKINFFGLMTLGSFAQKKETAIGPTPPPTNCSVSVLVLINTSAKKCDGAERH